LMVDNMARDARLLEPVRQVIRNLEPALLRLVLVDPRFFTDKQHPARRLLHELTHRSLAFDAPDATGFDAFLREAQATLAPLFQSPIESAEVFEAKLAVLRTQWTRETQANDHKREAAVDVLQHAEARNLLAQEIARRIEGHPDSAQVPAVVLDFLCGPWSQVVAQARIKQGSGSVEAEKYEALVPAMLWSAHPELARSSPAKLTRLVPRLLTNLREGLETIQYPATRTSVFLEALMAVRPPRSLRRQTTFPPSQRPCPIACVRWTTIPGLRRRKHWPRISWPWRCRVHLPKRPPPTCWICRPWPAWPRVISRWAPGWSWRSAASGSASN
jgi:hypothetical protein